MAFFTQQHHLQQPPPNPYRNFAPADGQTTAPIAFLCPTSRPDQSQPPFVHVMGLAPGSVPTADGGSNWWEPRRKKVKEQDLLENSQISSIDFLQTGSVSTGLGLSLDDRRVAASSGDSPLLLPMIDEDINREIERVDAEMDRFIKIEVERLRQLILEKLQAKQFQSLANVEDNILRKIREKEAEVEEINKRNMELEEQMKQLAMEIGTWQHRAKYNENTISHLKYSLDQVYAQSRDNKEGCGDSEVDDTASCCNGRVVNFQLMCKENKDLKESMACKICKGNEACMLLLPCRHLCLCKECESRLSFCPLCQSSKLLGMEIYM
ncbi:probable BOI-related E3 ubiquitin-protein ligase 2 [Phoenix dactylifera]|uniref:Probable BOI-related E3 ubiquitin-protein ligase 2 n=1 Tax=Phoenix dactylifera TaxID=42345 RepID=A0A8B7BNP0_PHODC|nr:probable BOI-related E3 ubiquitin-protein ligase 2 [Phoenix dactylifera]XP_038986012.1 probable BOI-related E3 ubiquitin-protein ligase 2 [Phoenix dactylifera]